MNRLARPGVRDGPLGRAIRLVTVFGGGARGQECAHGVACLSPPGESIKDDFHGGQSPLSEVYIASRFSLNSLPLGFQKISCFLQLFDKLFDFRNRRSSNLLNKWRITRVDFGLGQLHNTPLSSLGKSKFSPARWQTHAEHCGSGRASGSVFGTLGFDYRPADLSPTDGAAHLPKPSRTRAICAGRSVVQVCALYLLPITKV